MTLRLREHLAQKFTEKKKTKSDIYQSARGMGKLFKEAERVKKVLSANTDHKAQVSLQCTLGSFSHPVRFCVYSRK